MQQVDPLTTHVDDARTPRTLTALVSHRQL